MCNTSESNRPVCLPHTYICDGNKDCINGEDEASCTIESVCNGVICPFTGELYCHMMRLLSVTVFCTQLLLLQVSVLILCRYVMESLTALVPCMMRLAVSPVNEALTSVSRVGSA